MRPARNDFSLYGFTGHPLGTLGHSSTRCLSRIT